jgi:hypothetical protein
MVKLSVQELRQIRSYSQRLDKSYETVAGLINHLLGLQSQELPSASLAIRSRTLKTTLDNVKEAREDERSIILTWAMRGTMHLVSRFDYHWLNSLFAPVFLHASKRRYAELMLDAETLDKANELINQMLDENGPMTRPEIAKALASHNIPVAGQAIAHIVGYAALKGSICFGPERDGVLTYVLVHNWLKPEVTYLPRKPILELARRYLIAYAPAKPKDFSVWSGLSMKDAKLAFADLSSELNEVEVLGETCWVLKLQEIEKCESLRLLPRYDNYWLGYESRELLVDDEYSREIHPGGGLIHPAMAINGEGKGSWRMEQKHGKFKLKLKPFGTLDSSYVPQIEAEVEDIGRFLNQTIQMEIENF